MSGLTSGANRYIFGCMKYTPDPTYYYVFLLRSVSNTFPDEKANP